MLCVSTLLLCSRTRRGGEEKSAAGLLCKVRSPLSWERHSPVTWAVTPRGSLGAGPVRVRWRSSVGCRFLTSFYSAITLRVIASIMELGDLGTAAPTTLVRRNDYGKSQIGKLIMYSTLGLICASYASSASTILGFYIFAHFSINFIGKI